MEKPLDKHQVLFKINRALEIAAKKNKIIEIRRRSALDAFKG